MAESASSSKLLSFVLVGKNDSYMGNYIYRITTAINFLARSVSLLRRQDDVEIMVTDWGSDVPLSQALELTPEAAQITSFQYVSPQQVREARPDGGFFASKAANVSVRRSRGQYVCITDADCMMPLHSLQAVLGLLDGDTAIPFDVDSTLFFVMRHQIPWEIVQREPTLAFWERYLLLNSGSSPAEEHMAGYGGSGSGNLMSRRLWHLHRGFSETLTGMGWIDVDLTLRVTQRYPMLDLAGLGVSQFHMEHWPRNKRRATWVNNVVNPYLVDLSITSNSEDWGMGNHALVEQRPSRIVSTPTAPRAADGGIQALGSAAVARMVSTLMPRWRVSQVDWESLCALAWYAYERMPLAFVEFDSQSLMAAAVVGGICQGVEIYALDTWRKRKVMSTPAHFCTGLRQNGYRGYLRFAVGPPVAAFATVQASAASTSLDLVSMAWEAGPDWKALLLQVAASMSAEGMLVVRFPAPATCREVWAEVVERFPQHLHLYGASGQTAFMLGNQSQAAAQSTVIDFGRPRMLSGRLLAKRSIHLMRRALEDPRLVVDQLRAVFLR